MYSAWVDTVLTFRRPSGMFGSQKSKTSNSSTRRLRKIGVYTPIFRNRLVELFEGFDFCDPNIPLGRRNVSTVSTQALYMMNSAYVMDQARQAARKILERNSDDAGRLDLAYRTAL